MKKLGALLLSVVLLFGLASFLTAQESMNDFVLVNKTGYTIDQVYVSLAKGNTWEEDVLGQETLKDGEEVTIKFNPKAATGLYDLRVVYDDKSDAVWTELDLTTINKVTIHYDANKDVTSAETE